MNAPIIRTHLRQHLLNIEEKELLRIRQAAFYRGGTSKGLLVASKDLFPYDQNDRNRILSRALGSPDPDGRQIDGLGGGTSSTSKVAIVSKINDPIDKMAFKMNHPFPLGKDAQWIDQDTDRVAKVADIVYRFGQVSIKGENEIDWGSTCGNMVSAAAHFALREGMYMPKLAMHFFSEEGLSPTTLSHLRKPFRVSLRILAHDSGKVIKVYTWAEFVRIGNKIRLQPIEHGDVRISGVPGTAAGTVVETPLKGGSVLSTGNERDVVEVNGKKVEISIVNTGLPVVFVHANSLGISISDLCQHPASIDSNKSLIDLLETVRHAACQLTPELQCTYSKPSPKLCLIHEPVSYTTTGGVEVRAEEMDIFIRVLSTGQLHRTVPATTLSATAAAKCHANTIVAELIRRKNDFAVDRIPESTAQLSKSIDHVSRIDSNHHVVTVGQPAGVTSTCVKMNKKTGEPETVFDVRSARMIMFGGILPAHDVKPHPDLQEAYKEFPPMPQTAIRDGQPLFEF